MTKINYNPDVLSCLASLSNDEVFTPPEIANQMLDLLPQEIWSNKNAKFLDPSSKSGVFLREITKRLIKGLEKQIPDKQKRIDHILSNQVYGIGITELTALMSRRTLYCSKDAAGKYSVSMKFKNKVGNIIYNKEQHTWEDGKCVYCGASQEVYDRSSDLETHAYDFIHSEKPEEIFNMKFDVIIGNPPYQLNDGGGTGSSAKPIYNKFVHQAKSLNPRYLVMIIPARWYSGGKGLDEFRDEMLNDTRIRYLVDFPDSRACFPGVDIAGGICYFLWDRDNRGKCNITSFRNNQIVTSLRNLNQFKTFIRDNVAVEIVDKIRMVSADFLISVVSSRNPFGLGPNFESDETGDLILVSSTGRAKIRSELISSNKSLITKWKVLLSKASFDHGGQPDKDGKRKIFSRVEIMPPGVVCTESYLSIGSFENEIEAMNLMNYLNTKFCRFLVSTVLLTQNITRGSFVFVPNLSFQESWSDEKLYKKYKLTKEEIAFIESMIRPMTAETKEEVAPDEEDE